MKKLTLRREVVRNLVAEDLSRVAGGVGPSYACTTAISCTDPLGCLPTHPSVVVGSVNCPVNTLRGCTTAMTCP